MLKVENGVNVLPEPRAKVSRTVFKYMNTFYMVPLSKRVQPRGTTAGTSGRCIGGWSSASICDGVVTKKPAIVTAA